MGDDQKRAVCIIFSFLLIMTAVYAYSASAEVAITGKSHIYANGHHIASVSGNEITYYHNDYLGSVRLTTNENNEQTVNYDYAPFGSTIEENGYLAAMENSKKFTGKEADANLYYFGARYYDADAGRFITLDPLYNPTESPYAYVKNNPIKFIDPTGRKAIVSNDLNQRTNGFAQKAVDIASRNGFIADLLYVKDVMIMTPHDNSMRKDFLDREAEATKAIGKPVQVKTITYTSVNSEKFRLRPDLEEANSFIVLRDDSLKGLSQENILKSILHELVEEALSGSANKDGKPEIKTEISVNKMTDSILQDLVNQGVLTQESYDIIRKDMVNEGFLLPSPEMENQKQ